MPRDELAALLIAARKKAGYKTLYALAKATGISHATLHGIEHGTRSPSVETLEMIMNAIGWNVDVTFRPRKMRRRRR
jgi:transcriptional regulator with XRE-family HTH domain